MCAEDVPAALLVGVDLGTCAHACPPTDAFAFPGGGALAASIDAVDNGLLELQASRGCG